MSYSREVRTLRDRQAVLDRAIDISVGRKDFAVARKLVQVYDQGAMPTAGDHFFATHPVMLNGNECESCSATPVVDTDTTIYVDFLRSAPAVGDIAVAVAVGGKWVAEEGAPQAGCNCGNCGTCLIPRQDLSISWVNPIVGDGSATLAYNGTNWISDCTNQLLFTVACITGIPVLQITYYLSGSCPTGQSQTAATNKDAPFSIILDSLACASGGTPFQMKAHVTSASNGNIASFGYTTFQIDGPAMPPGPLMCATFCPSCCDPSQISTVSIYSKQDGTILATGMTGPTGCVTLYWTGKPGNYYVAASGTNCINFAGVLTLVCGGSYFCCAKICVSGCLGIPIEGATVTISNPDNGTISAGETDSTGCVKLGIITSGPYTATASAEGFVSYSGTVTLGCNLSDAITLGIDPSTGYFCGCGVPNSVNPNFHNCVPIKSTLMASDGLGVVPVSWNAAGPLGGGWYGCAIRTVGGICVVDSACGSVAMGGAVPFFFHFYCIEEFAGGGYSLDLYIPFCKFQSGIALQGGLQSLDCTAIIGLPNLGLQGNPDSCSPFHWTSTRGICTPVGVCNPPNPDCVWFDSGGMCLVYGCNPVFEVTE